MSAGESQEQLRINVLQLPDKEIPSELILKREKEERPTHTIPDSKKAQQPPKSQQQWTLVSRKRKKPHPSQRGPPLRPPRPSQPFVASSILKDTWQNPVKARGESREQPGASVGDGRSSRSLVGSKPDLSLLSSQHCSTSSNRHVPHSQHADIRDGKEYGMCL
ncbi:hypothetical protein AMTR_s00012p00139640 [Amborella trichopoda]|uniref:Uncharacterized protein n=1 Tax=Amborella trichopoda TaxID=13333 RepID=W1PJF5_AMBTC|nr:hypothetical protein AMTR_s00012p00139640 [Amborella trichopoda]